MSHCRLSACTGSIQSPAWGVATAIGLVIILLLVALGYGGFARVLGPPLAGEHRAAGGSAVSTRSAFGFGPLVQTNSTSSMSASSTATNSSNANSSVNPAVGCSKPPTGYTCMAVVLPASDGSYLASADVGGEIFTTPGYAEVELNSKVSISVYTLVSGYAFSFWGTSPSEISVTQFELGSTTAVVTGAGASLYLNVYEGSHGAQVYFEVYYDNVTQGTSAGQALLEDHAFLVGQYAWLTIGQSYSIAAEGFASGFGFGQWASQVGTLGNLTAETTTFDAFEGGTLALVLQQGPASWGGYVISNLDVTSAEGTFTLPNSFTTEAGAVEHVGFWVGIGGTSQYGALLWQAGVVLEWGDGSLSILPFYEAAGPSSCTPCGPPTYGTERASPGDTITVSVTESSGGDTSLVDDVSQGWSFSGSSTLAPNSQSAEWIGECPSCSPATKMYAFAPVLVSKLVLNDQSITLAGPVSEVWAAYYASGLSPSYLGISDEYEQFHITPSSIQTGYN
jgi:hypothetical protein